MDGPGQYSIEDDGADGAVLALSGPLLVSSIGAVETELRGIDYDLTRIDMSGVDEIDTVGAWVAFRLSKDHSARITGASDQAQRLLSAVEHSWSTADIAPPRQPVWRRVPQGVGDQVYIARDGIVGGVGSFGQILVGFGNPLRHTSRSPRRALLRQPDSVGVSAVPLTGLASFLFGIVLPLHGDVRL